METFPFDLDSIGSFLAVISLDKNNRMGLSWDDITLCATSDVSDVEGDTFAVETEKKARHHFDGIHATTMNIRTGMAREAFVDVNIKGYM